MSKMLLNTDKGDAVVAYRKDDMAVVSGIQDALERAGVGEVWYAYDAISERNSYVNIRKVPTKDGNVCDLEFCFHINCLQRLLSFTQLASSRRSPQVLISNRSQVSV